MYWCRLQHGWKSYDVEWRKLVTKAHILYDPIGILPIGIIPISIIPLVDSVHIEILVVAWGWGMGREHRRWPLTEWSFFLQWWEYSEIRQWWELHCSVLYTVLSRSVMSNSLWPPWMQPTRLSVPGDSPGKNTGVGCHALLQGIFPTQGSNPGLLHCRQILYRLSHQGSPRILEWVTYPFSRGSSWPRNWTGVSFTAGGFFTSWVAALLCGHSGNLWLVHFKCLTWDFPGSPVVGIPCFYCRGYRFDPWLQN